MNRELALRRLKEKAFDQRQRLHTVEANIENYLGKLKTLEQDIQKFHEAKQLFIEAAKFSREKTVGDAERNLTAALRAIFQDHSMAFEIEITEKRNNMNADFFVCFEVDGERIRVDPLEAKGGSIVDVVTTGLLLVFLKTYKPQKRQILFLDEPGKFLDSERRTRYGKWIYRMSHDLAIQIIMITHDPELRAVADRLFELRPCDKIGVMIETSDPEVHHLDGYGFEART